jgi:hypothetical protein
MEAGRQSESEAAAQGNQNLEQVRELLFGETRRALEQNLARLEEQFTVQAEEALQQTRKWLDLVETHLAREVEGLGGRIQKERTAQSEALRGTAEELHKAVTALEARAARLEESITRAQRDLRQQMLEQARAFLDEVHRVRAEVVAMLDREFALFRGGAIGATEREEASASPEP